MGETLEAWIFFAVIIIANAKSPLDSALKTFVFFLISQPLIYLLQVPFSWQGWGLFQYYKHWFILTLCTFPAAYIGWYIKKKNWLSLLILMPVLILLAYLCEDGLKHVIHQFPSLLIMVVFCVLQVFLLPVMLVLFVLRVLVKIGIELSSIIVGGLILIIFGCIIYAIVQQMWSSAPILIAMEAVLIIVTAGAGILDVLLEEASINLGLLIRS